MGCRIVFIGGIWNKKEEKKIIHNSIGSVQIAANVLQTALIQGLDANISDPLTILNEIFVGAFPFRYKKLFINSGLWNHSDKEGHIDYNVGFLNLPLIKHFSRYIHLKKYIRQTCSFDSDDQIYVIGYSMTYSVVEGLLYAKRINPNIRTCLIVPDLPEYMNLGKQRNFAFNFMRDAMSRRLYKSIKQLDSFVTLTKYIYEALDVTAPYTVVEGVVSGQIDSKCEKANGDTKDFVYTGSIAEKYGVTRLVDAFSQVYGDDLRLVICGAGDGLDHIQNIAAKDPRIQYLGVVPNDEARRLQQNAYVLVNPRSNKEEYTKYSFPSKTMEYMVTGRPVLMYKLKGIPDEYDDYIYYIGDDMRQSIERLATAAPEEISEKGDKAKQFVLQNKNKNKQAQKILNLLNSLN